MFKDLKAGDLIHVIEVDSSTGIPQYYTSVISSVTPSSTASAYPLNPDMSLVCRLGSDEKDIAKINPSSASVKVGAYQLFTDKDQAMHTIRAIHDENKIKIASTDKYQAIVQSCAELLTLNGLSPQSDSQRLTSLEESVKELKGGMTDIKSMLSSLVNELTPTGNEKCNSEQEGV